MYHPVIEQLFTFGRPRGFRGEFINAQAFTAAPDAGGVINGQLFFGGFRHGGLARSSGCSHDDPRLFQFDLFESPYQSLALTVAWFVLQERHMVLCGGNPFAPVPRRFVALIHGKHGYGRCGGIGWQVGESVHHGFQRDVSQICGRAVVANHAIGKQSERMRGIAKIGALALNADAAAAVGVIDEDNLASVRERLVDGRELANFGSERPFNGRCSWFIFAQFFSCVQGRHEHAASERSDAEERGCFMRKKGARS